MLLRNLTIKLNHFFLCLSFSVKLLSYCKNIDTLFFGKYIIVKFKRENIYCLFYSYSYDFLPHHTTSNILSHHSL